MNTKDNILLSICIPTFNRASQLEKTLNGIISDLDKGIVEQVEIIISDNASTDNTEDIVKSFQEINKNVVYSQNNKNLGYDRNVDRVLSLSGGKFCWTLSDDDFIKKNSIQTILSIIKENSDIAYICIDTNDIVKDSTYLYIQDGNHWFLSYGLTMGGLLSQNIFNKKYLPSDMGKYYDNLWFHLSIVFDILGENKAILTKNIFKKDGIYSECRWAKGGFNLITYISLKKIIENLNTKGYDQHIIDIQLQNMAKGLPRIVITARIAGLKITNDVIRTMHKEFKNYPVLLIFAFCALFVPAIAWRIGKKIKNVI